MSIPEDIKDKLYNALEIYNNEEYKYIRKAFDDDNVLIMRGVNINDIIIAFDLYKKDFYIKNLKIVNEKNNKEEIKNNKSNNLPYIIYTLKYYISEFDHTGNSKYNKLYLQELKETYKYDNKIKKYIMSSYKFGGKKFYYELKYIDLLDNTYNTIELVVKKILQLEKKIPKDYKYSYRQEELEAGL